jgi:hypothetical protein
MGVGIYYFYHGFGLKAFDYWELDHGGITGLLGVRPWWNNRIIGS